MSTDVEVLLYLVETAEEILNTCSLSYDTVLKYELTREKVFKQIGLALNSSKLWRLQNDPGRRVGAKPKVLQHDIPTHEYIESLSCSHETTLKYAKLIQTFLDSYEKLNQNLGLLVDSSVPGVQTKAFKLQELEQIYYKDLSKFKEINSKELQMLEMYSKQFFQIEKNLHLNVLGVEEKCVMYEKNLKNLESHVDSILFKNKAEKDEFQSRLQELLETCHDYSEQIEELKAQNSEILLNEKKSAHLKKTSVDFEILTKLETQVSELNKDITGRDKRIEKLTETLRMMESRNVDLRKELSLNEKLIREKFKDELIEQESQTTELRQLLEQKDQDLSTLTDKLKFLQDELSSYKFHKDQELKKSQTESKELHELKAKYNELKEENSFYKSKINELKEELVKYKNLCVELKEELSKYKNLCVEFKEEISELQLKCSEANEENSAKKNLAKLEESVHKIIERFTKSEESEISEDSSRVMNEIEYVNQLVQKLCSDNDWLVDRLADLGQENHRLMQEVSPSKLRDEDFAELKATSNAFKEFENSRSKIFYKF